MTEPTYLSKSAFAARIGRAPSYITWLKNNNRLVLSPDGKLVDVQASEALIRDTADPSKAAVADRHQQDRIQRDVYSQLSTQTEPTSTAAPPQVLTGDGKLPDFQKARALREHNMAKLAEIELGKAQGALVSKEAVETGAYNAGRLLRDQLFGPLPQLSHDLAAMTDPWLIEKHLTATFRRTLEEAERLSSADLEHAMTTD
ncbi:terminase small subunit [Pseudomonas jessenii]|uniref:Terminase small subunit n=2 Tax=Pseudomonas TaxID=286 RepID=A0A5C4KSR6_PSEJE|nr:MULTISPECIES: terminase small subunit [Pseudomonas]PHH39783.1 terminase small subunit [Pseudomonas putida]TNB91778.1 terminase small subunit [Pseudomonas jessenii]